MYFKPLFNSKLALEVKLLIEELWIRNIALFISLWYPIYQTLGHNAFIIISKLLLAKIPTPPTLNYIR